MPLTAELPVNTISLVLDRCSNSVPPLRLRQIDQSKYIDSLRELALRGNVRKDTPTYTLNRLMSSQPPSLLESVHTDPAGKWVILRAIDVTLEGTQSAMNTFDWLEPHGELPADHTKRIFRESLYRAMTADPFEGTHSLEVSKPGKLVKVGTLEGNGYRWGYEIDKVVRQTEIPVKVLLGLAALYAGFKFNPFFQGAGDLHAAAAQSWAEWTKAGNELSSQFPNVVCTSHDSVAYAPYEPGAVDWAIRLCRNKIDASSTYFINQAKSVVNDIGGILEILAVSGLTGLFLKTLHESAQQTDIKKGEKLMLVVEAETSLDQSSQE